jgi:hypothetical protein
MRKEEIDNLYKQNKFNELHNSLSFTDDDYSFYIKFCVLFELQKYEDLINSYITLNVAKNPNKYEINLLYYNSLSELNKHEELIKLLAKELEDQTLDPIYQQNLIALYDETFDKIHNIEVEEKEISDIDLLHIMQQFDNTDAYSFIIRQLKRKKIEPFIPIIEEIFLNRDILKVYKIMLLDVLGIKAIDKEFTIKSTPDFKLNPKKKNLLIESDVSKKIIDYINEKDINAPEGFSKYIDDILVELIVYLYPEQIEEHLVPYYAYIIVEFAATLLQVDEDYIDEIAEQFNIDDDDVLDSCFEIVSKAFEK